MTDFKSIEDAETAECQCECCGKPQDGYEEETTLFGKIKRILGF